MEKALNDAHNVQLKDSFENKWYESALICMSATIEHFCWPCTLTLTLTECCYEHNITTECSVLRLEWEQGTHLLHSFKWVVFWYGSSQIYNLPIYRDGSHQHTSMAIIRIFAYWAQKNGNRWFFFTIDYGCIWFSLTEYFESKLRLWN